MPSKRSNNDLRDQVGQLLIFGFDGLDVSAKLRSALVTMRPGGIILFKRNCADARQVHALLRDCERSVAIPMFLCVDMEGGTVDRLKDVITPAPSVADVASTGNKKLFRLHGRVIGEEIRALGFNTDFAPVVDLGLDVSREVLTTRTASADPKAAIAYAKEFHRGLRQAGILGCEKHFPGLGETSLDTHFKLPRVSKSFKAMWNEDLVPYRVLHREFPFVMVAHVAYPDAGKTDRPASISKFWITDVLRKKIGYRGLVISDDLEMGGVQAYTDIETAAIECIRAGADIFLICHNDEHVWRTYNAVLREAEKDRKFAKQVAHAAARVLAFKRKSREVKRRMGPPPTDAVVNKLRRNLWELGEEIRLAKLEVEEAVL